MAGNQCSPDAIVGSVRAMYDSTGLGGEAFPPTMSRAEKQAYVRYHDAQATQQFMRQPINTATQAVHNLISGRSTRIQEGASDQVPGKENAMRAFINGTRRFSSVLGDETIQPFDELMERHLPTRHAEGARKAYTDEVTALIKQHEKANPHLEVIPEWEDYKYFLTNGGGLYKNPHHQKGIDRRLEKVANNVTANVIRGNFNVAGGNLIEIVKVPALYGADSIKHLPEVMNLMFKPHPELVRSGALTPLHELLADAPTPDQPGFRGQVAKWNRKGNDALQATTMLFETPLKNWAYLTGVEKNGGHAGGLKAVQDVSFQGRLADPMMSSTTPLGRSATTLMNYSINNIRMYHGLLHRAYGKNQTVEQRKTALVGLAMYHVAMGLGAGAINALEGKDFWESFKIGAMQVPLLFELANYLSPEMRDWVKENEGAGTKMVRAASIGTGFVAAQIAASSAKKVVSEFGKVGDSFSEGDNAGAINHLMRGYIKSKVFTPNLLGTRAGQKASEWLLDWWEGEAEDNIINRVTGIGDQE
jgi:hypothetical protein